MHVICYNIPPNKFLYILCICFKPDTSYMYMSFHIASSNDACRCLNLMKIFVINFYHFIFINNLTVFSNLCAFYRPPVIVLKSKIFGLNIRNTKSKENSTRLIDSTIFLTDIYIPNKI